MKRINVVVGVFALLVSAFLFAIGLDVLRAPFFSGTATVYMSIMMAAIGLLLLGSVIWEGTRAH